MSQPWNFGPDNKAQEAHEAEELQRVQYVDQTAQIAWLKQITGSTKV